MKDNTAELKSQAIIESRLIRYIATSRDEISRGKLAEKMNVSKMTVSKHISRLIQLGIITEGQPQRLESQVMGRRPVGLRLSDTSPCLCGIFIRRTYVQIILTDLSSTMIDTIKEEFPTNLTADMLLDIILSGYDRIRSRTSRRIVGCGVSCIGPVDSKLGYILSPPNFFGITNVPIVSALHAHTGLPCFLSHDVSAGALIERLYGKGTKYNNFMFLHMQNGNGIGVGYVMNGKCINNDLRRSGEIGHTSINYDGPQCMCGNRGCLEVYASLQRMQGCIKNLLPVYQNSKFHPSKEISWNNILDFASDGDAVAVAALDEYCSYLIFGITNALKLLEFDTIIIGYESAHSSNIIERMLRAKVQNIPEFANLSILHSSFDGDAPLFGAVALVANEVFSNNIPLI